jgi:hypothetical protein
MKPAHEMRTVRSVSSTRDGRSSIRLDCSVAEAVRRAGGGAPEDHGRGRAAHAVRVFEILSRERHAAGCALGGAPLSRRTPT